MNIEQFPHMVTTLAKDGGQILSEMEAHQMHLTHMAIGLMGEVVELFDAVANQDVGNILEELGDIEFYFEGACQWAEIRPSHDGQVEPALTADDLLVIINRRAGEILDTAKRVSIYQDKKNDLVSRMRDQLSSMRWLLDSLYGALNIGRESALKANMEKLAIRYNGYNYSNDAATARADKEGEQNES